MDFQISLPVFDLLILPLLAGLVVGLWFLERRWPLRVFVKNAWRRLATNTLVGAPAFVIMRLTLIPAQMAAAYWAAREGFGLLRILPIPDWAAAILGFLALDYLLYIWHVMSHRVPWLWRLHNVHHTDRDLTVTTAFRFHFLEMIVNGIFRIAAVALFGVGALVVLVYEGLYEAEVAFHHSNWRLPRKWDKALSWIIVTPRMHGIHHSEIKEETDSNYSSFFSIWDRLHRTLRLNKKQKDIVIGVPGYRDGFDLTIFGLLTLPFRKQKPYWKNDDKPKPPSKQ